MTKLREKIKDHIDAIATMAANQGYYSDAESQETTDAIMALIKPKELVWETMTDDKFLHYSETPISSYNFTTEHVRLDDGFLVFLDDVPISEDDFFSPIDAKAAAQEHYNRMWLDMMGGE